jgi:AcrR family transcriptional regulator
MYNASIMTDDLGLRDRKKRETRRLLSEVATRLFADRGFEAVKVSDIAAEANVSEKTVFNYFETKEDLVLEGRAEVEADLLRAVRERGPGEPIIEAVRRHTLAVAERMNALPAERRNSFRKVVATTPSVHARMRELSLRTEDELARLLAEDTGKPPTDPIARTVAGVLGVLTRLAFGFLGGESRRWRHAEVIASIDEGFDLLAHGLARYGARPRR